MKILDYFNDIIDKFEIRQWPMPERVSLFRVLLEVYHSDGEFSENEREAFRSSMLGTGVSEDDVSVDFSEAIAELKKDAKKMELVRFWVAASIFDDDDYDKKEQAFIKEIIIKYDLNEQALKGTIRQLRDKKMDEAITDWYYSMDNRIGS